MIDVKELRIGSSVLVNGVRAKVIDIHRDILNSQKSSYRVFVEGISPETGKLMQVGGYEFDPIPLTEELLKELGFKEDKEPEEGWYFGIEKVFLKEFDSPIEEDYYISMAQYEGGLYQLQVLGTIAYVRDLHTLQNLIYLTTKKELI